MFQQLSSGTPGQKNSGIYVAPFLIGLPIAIALLFTSVFHGTSRAAGNLSNNEGQVVALPLQALSLAIGAAESQQDLSDNSGDVAASDMLSRWLQSAGDEGQLQQVGRQVPAQQLAMLFTSPSQDLALRAIAATTASPDGVTILGRLAQVALTNNRERAGAAALQATLLSQSMTTDNFEPYELLPAEVHAMGRLWWTAAERKQARIDVRALSLEVLRNFVFATNDPELRELYAKTLSTWLESSDTAMVVAAAHLALSSPDLIAANRLVSVLQKPTSLASSPDLIALSCAHESVTVLRDALRAHLLTVVAADAIGDSARARTYGQCIDKLWGKAQNDPEMAQTLVRLANYKDEKR